MLASQAVRSFSSVRREINPALSSFSKMFQYKFHHKTHRTFFIHLLVVVLAPSARFMSPSLSGCFSCCPCSSLPDSSFFAARKFVTPPGHITRLQSLRPPPSLHSFIRHRVWFSVSLQDSDQVCVCPVNEKTAYPKQQSAHLLHCLHIPHNAAACSLCCASLWFFFCQSTPIRQPHILSIPTHHPLIF